MISILHHDKDLKKTAEGSILDAVGKVFTESIDISLNQNLTPPNPKRPAALHLHRKPVQ
jgi:hypothetical protein